MPVFELSSERPSFPPPEFADANGLLAVGGALTADWLEAAYRKGILVWGPPLKPLYWWAPPTRVVLMRGKEQVPPIAEALMKKRPYRVYENAHLKEVIAACRQRWNRTHQSAGWIRAPFVEAYEALEARGRVRSTALYEADVLKGGAFGARIGDVFFGEYVVGDNGYAEAALLELVKRLWREGVQIVDLHKGSAATENIGFQEIPRADFLALLEKHIT